MVSKGLGKDCFFPMERLQQFIPGQTPTKPQKITAAFKVSDCKWHSYKDTLMNLIQFYTQEL